MSCKRLAIAGFSHETNTMAPTQATYEEFEKEDSWPGLLRGAEVMRFVHENINMPTTGVLKCVQGSDSQVDLKLSVWASAEPSNYVTSDAFERIMTMIVEDMQGFMIEGPLDGVFLDLHGAMVSEQYGDGEGEILRRVRAVVGESVPIVASLDFHANISPDMIEQCDGFAIYRTYPHLDLEETGTRAYNILRKLWDGNSVYKSHAKPPFLIPLTAQCTHHEPSTKIYAKLEEIAGKSGIVSIDFAEGFPAADTYYCGPSVVVYAETQELADACLEEMLNLVNGLRDDFDSQLIQTSEAVAAATATATALVAGKPVVIADPQDNPGAGASSDTVGILEELVRCYPENKLRSSVALVYDPEAARQAHDIGLGASAVMSVGGHLCRGHTPLQCEMTVTGLPSGTFPFTGEMYRGSVASIGPCAKLQVKGTDITVLVCSERCQCLDLAIFRHFNVEPTEQQALVVKSSVHFRADFEPIAAKVVVASSPGANVCRVEEIPYKRIRGGVQLYPTKQFTKEP